MSAHWWRCDGGEVVGWRGAGVVRCWEWEERCDYEAHFGSPSNATHDDIDNDDEPTPKMFCPVPPNLWRVNPTRDFSVVVDLVRPYGR